LVFLCQKTAQIRFMKTITINKLIGILLLFGVFVFALGREAFADGDSDPYGIYAREVINKVFRVEKKVRVGDSGSFSDKVTHVAKGEIVEFQIVVKNEGDMEVNDMKMVDILPKEMERVGGSQLTETWDNFEVCTSEKCEDERKVFIIKAKVKDSEFDREDFEKCVVNKAEIYYKDKFEGADTATVCYGKVPVTELPKTGTTSTALVTIGGLSLVYLGKLLKKRVY
jgi:uncharacterized repeat protein (TIGR01451 family)/LPXTG-motif cell wall-anchored protein